jgi:hypothetical protein
MTTSEQARANAMADAETLRALPSFYFPDRSTEETFNVLHYTRCAVVVGSLSDPSNLPTYAERAARAAFRAVPGLRG